MFTSQYHCPDCGGSEAFRSRPRTLAEKYIFRLLFLHPVRCANCFRRTHVSSFALVRERGEKPDAQPRAAA
jgi:hypothetical protein